MALPLTLPFYDLNDAIDIQTTIVNNYQTAEINFCKEDQSLYSTKMDQPTTELPESLEIGDLTIHGGKLELQAPTKDQPGIIVLSGSYSDPHNTETPLNAVIAMWNDGQ